MMGTVHPCPGLGAKLLLRILTWRSQFHTEQGNAQEELSAAAQLYCHDDIEQPLDQDRADGSRCPFSGHTRTVPLSLYIR